MKPTIQLYLASTSPRRQALLEQLGLVFDVVSIDIDESKLTSELPMDYVQRLALNKAREGWGHVQRSLDIPVLGSDTAVVLDGKILGKPRDLECATQMLSRLSGQCHQVMTAIALKYNDREAVCTQISQVSFRAMKEHEIKDYCQTGEPEGKAGGYAIQGLAAQFIQHLEGSYSGVMGLPLFETAELLTQFGVKIMSDNRPCTDYKNKPEK